MFLKQSTALTIILGPFLDDTDGKTPETALTVTSIDVDLYKNNSKSDLTITASAGNNDMAHVANGYYSLELTSGNTDTLGRLLVTANITGALPVWLAFAVLPANVYDSLIAGSDKLDTDTYQITNNAITAAALAADAGAELADALWDEGLGSHLTAGSAGRALNDAGGSSDPWSTALPGSYTSGQAGWLIGQRLDAKVSAMSGSSPGAGAAEFTYTLTESGSGDPIPDADVWATTDSLGSVVVASGRTNQLGRVTFYLDPGTVYIWRQKSGWDFTNPDTEIVP